MVSAGQHNAPLAGMRSDLPHRRPVFRGPAVSACSAGSFGRIEIHQPAPGIGLFKRDASPKAPQRRGGNRRSTAVLPPSRCAPRVTTQSRPPVSTSARARARTRSQPRRWIPAHSESLRSSARGTSKAARSTMPRQPPSRRAADPGRGNHRRCAVFGQAIRYRLPPCARRRRSRASPHAAGSRGPPRQQQDLLRIGIGRQRRNIAAIRLRKAA